MLTKIQADIYDLLVIRKKLRPSMIRSFLEERTEYANRSSRTLDVQIIRVLKKLIHRKLVYIPEIDDDRNTWYGITPEGVKQASLLLAYSKLENDEPTKIVKIDVSDVLSDVDLRSKAEVTTAFYLDAPKDKKDKVTEHFFSTYADLLAQNLVSNLKISMTRETKNICQNSEKSLDFEVMLFFHFNGKKLVESFHEDKMEAKE